MAAPEQQPTKDELLAKYAEGSRVVRGFLQLDGWRIAPGDEDHIMQPDADGDACFSRSTYELRASPGNLVVRVQIHEGAQKEETLRLLRKLTDWLEQDWESMPALKPEWNGVIVRRDPTAASGRRTFFIAD
jgi:hypothetical protein